MSEDTIKYLLDASWIFFAIWLAVLVAVSVITFSRDFRHDSHSSAKDLPRIPSPR